MKYCSKCGAELLDEAIICPKCGCETDSSKALKQQNDIEASEKKAKTFGILSLVFGALGGWLGLVFGIICIKSDKTHKYRVMGILGIVMFAIWIVILAILNV